LRTYVALLVVAVVSLAPGGGAHIALAQGQVDPELNTKWMDPATILRWDCARRIEWARLRIGNHMDALGRSAQANRIPPELLAAIILNELADYDLLDIGQERTPSTGSVGIAQINVNTAIQHGLMRGYVSDAEVRILARTGFIPINRAEGTTDEQAARQFLTWSKLNDNEIAIEAAAREIDRILDEMSANPNGPWAKFFVAGPLDRANIYANVKPSHIGDERTISGERLAALQRRMNPAELQRRRESALAIGVAAAYNTPNILTADYDHTRIWNMPPDGHPFLNARRHGLQADQIWVDCLQNAAAAGFLPGSDNACRTWSVEATLTHPSSTPGAAPSTHRVNGTWTYDPTSGQFRAAMADIEVRNWRYTFSLPKTALRPGESFSFRSVESDGSFRDALGNYQGQVVGPGTMSGTFEYQGGGCCSSGRVLGQWRAVCADRR
jgi:hypothetical protein